MAVDNEEQSPPTSRADWRRRIAVQVVSMLPDGKEDALATLNYARDFVEGFVFVAEDRDG